MILKNLTLKNFKQYGHLELEFREGLVGVVGRNGSGKSSVFEAILLCLFGSISLDKNHYKSSWVEAKESVVLELTFEVGQKNWKVRREYRGKALSPKAYFYDQNDQLIATDSKPVTEEVIRLLGMDKDAFTRSIFSGQKELGIISNTKGEERKRMVRKMVGLDKLDDIQKIIREDRNTLNKEMQGQEKLLLSEEELQSVENQLKTLGGKLKDLTKKEKELEKVFTKKNAAYQKSKIDFDEQSKVSRQFNEMNLQLSKWEKGVEALLESLEKNQKETGRIEVLKSQKKQLEPQVQLFLDNKKKAEALEIKQQQFDRQKSFLQKQKMLEDQERAELQKLIDLKKDFSPDFDIKKNGIAKKEALTKCLSQQETHEKQIAELRTQRGEIKGRIKDRKSSVMKIEELGKDATCPTCLQPLIESYDSTLQKLQQEIEGYEKESLAKIETDLEGFEKALLAIKKQCAELNAEISQLRDLYGQLDMLEKNIAGISNNKKTVAEEIANFGKIDYDPETHLKLKRDLDDFESEYIRFKTIENEVAKLPELLEEIKEQKDRAKKGQKMIKDQQQAIAKLKFSPEKFAAAQQQMDELELAKDAAQKNLQQHIREINETKTTQRDFQKDLDNHQKIEQQIEASRKEYFHLDELSGIFQNFKTQILEKVRPSISFTASALFEKITKGRYEGIEVDENFEFQILEDGQYFPITRFSGGEIDLANLCLRIGISRAIAELSGSEEGMSFLGFDEIFGSQDEDRRFEILKALDHLKEQYRQVYIVSHINSIKEHFPEILEVRKTEEGSVVSWMNG